MSDLKIGQRVVVNGSHDGQEFTNERGVIIKNPDWMGSSTLTVRFDHWRDDMRDARPQAGGLGEGGDDGRHWHFDGLGPVRYTIAPEPASTYLNGEVALGDVLNAALKYREEARSRPRFMTAWMVDDGVAFNPTGDAFLTKEDAEAFARELLARHEQPDQIAVFELRSVHLARLTISSEAA